MKERDKPTSTTPAWILNRASGVQEVEDSEKVRVLGEAATVITPPLLNIKFSIS